MKVYYFILSFFSLSAAVVLFAMLNSSDNNTYPLPAETIVREKSESQEQQGKKDKAEYFELIHNAAPDVDWRKMDHDNRYNKYRSKIHQGSARISASSDSIANGYLVGTWKERGSTNQSGRIVYADIDSLSNDLYCASAGGVVWKGDLAGNNWTPLNDQMKFSGIKYLKKNHTGTPNGRLLCAANKYIYFSDDDGVTWQTSSGLTNVVSWGGIQRVLQLSDTAKTIIALVQEWDNSNWYQINSVYKSVDQGNSFVKMFDFDSPTYGNSNNFSIYVPYHEKQNAYLLQDSTLYLIDKNNNSYSLVSHIPVVSHGRVLLTGSKSFGQHNMYAYVDQYIYRSVDAGQTWTYASQIGKNPFSRNSFGASLLDPNKVYFGDIECWISNTGGQTWAKVNDWFDYYNTPWNKLHADIPAIISLIDASGTEVTLICTDGGLYVSTSQGSAVSNISYRNLNVSQYYSVYTHKTQTDFIYAGSQDQGFQRCQQDSGTALGFNQLISGDYGHIVSSNSGNSIWMVYPTFADFYADAKNSNHTKSYSFNGQKSLWMPPLIENPLNPNSVYYAGGDLNNSGGSHMIKLDYVSLNNTIIASQMSFDFAAPSGGFISAMSYSPLDLSHWYVATDNGKFFHSSDSGSTWTMASAFTGPSSHYFYGSAIHPSQRNPGTVFLAGSGYSNFPVFRSDDHGQTFTNISNGLPPTLVYDIVGTNDDSLLFAATELGPYVYVMRDNQWYDLAKNSAPDQTYWSVEYVQLINTVRFGTYGRGIWDFKIDNIYVGLNESAVVDLSVEIFPNPASNQINIKTSTINDPCLLKVYDIKGILIFERKFTVLQHEQIDISKLNQGLYIIDISNNSGRFTQKFIKN